MPRIVPLAGSHDRTSFACGEPALDAYLRDRAGQDVRRRLACCYVLLEDDRLAGFYTLSSAGIPMTDLPETLTRRLPRYPSLPAFRLGRLAVDVRFHGRGLGGLLLADALRRCLRAEAAGHLVLVEAKHERAATFYRHYGFRDLESRPLTLFLPLDTVRKIALPNRD